MTGPWSHGRARVGRLQAHHHQAAWAPEGDVTSLYTAVVVVLQTWFPLVWVPVCEVKGLGLPEATCAQTLEFGSTGLL